MLDPQRLIGLIIDDQYHLKDVKGIGSFGVVYAADVVALGSILGQAAVKLVWPPDDRTRQAIANEIQAMNQLQHAHLIAYRSSGQLIDGKASGAIYIAMELASHSLAFELASGKRLSEVDAVTLCTHIASALGYLQQRGAIHCDVKPANILRVGKLWKLGDFGLVRCVQADGGSPGTPRYKAPEALTKPGARSDIWSLGVVVQEAMTSELPYDGETEVQLMAQLLATEPRISGKLPPSVRAIVQGCLTKVPDKRWSAQRVVEETRKAGQAPAQPAETLAKPAVRPPEYHRASSPAAAPATHPPVPSVHRDARHTGRPSDGATPAPKSMGTASPAEDPASQSSGVPARATANTPSTAALGDLRRQFEQIQQSIPSLGREKAGARLRELLQRVRANRPSGGGTGVLAALGAVIAFLMAGPLGAAVRRGVRAADGGAADHDQSSRWDQLSSEIDCAIKHLASQPSAAPLSRTACPHCGADLSVWRDSARGRCAKCNRTIMSS